MPCRLKKPLVNTARNGILAHQSLHAALSALPSADDWTYDRMKQNDASNLYFLMFFPLKTNIFTSKRKKSAKKF
jgi:hypothetical protein